MEQKILSICIPTWNRDQIFKKTLENIITQALEFRDKVEICISNNASTDNTREVVMIFKEKYPDLIRYNENEINIGFDKNVLKVVNIAEGKFAWTFGDYSYIVEGGLKEVINFLESIEYDNVGLVGVRQEGYIFDEINNKKLIVATTVDKSEPQLMEMNAEEVIKKASLLGITHVILNTKLIKKIYKENYGLLERGVGCLYMHTWLYYIMFILNNNLRGYIINKVVVSTPNVGFGKTIEGHFRLIHHGTTKFFGVLQSICIERGEHDFANYFGNIKKWSKRYFIVDMLIRKSLNRFEYESFFGCLRLFFNNLKFADASLASVSFVIVHLIPSSFIRIMAKIYLKIKYGNKATSKWDYISKPIPISQKGIIRDPLIK